MLMKRMKMQESKFKIIRQILVVQLYNLQKYIWTTGKNILSRALLFAGKV